MSRAPTLSHQGSVGIPVRKASLLSAEPEDIPRFRIRRDSWRTDESGLQNVCRGRVECALGPVAGTRSSIKKRKWLRRSLQPVAQCLPNKNRRQAVATRSRSSNELKSKGTRFALTLPCSGLRFDKHGLRNIVA